MIILVAGESGSGKTKLAEVMAKTSDAVILSMDDFYKPKDQRFGMPDWTDNPNVIDLPLLLHTITRLEEQDEARVPVFSQIEEDRTGFITVQPKQNVIVEGLWALSFQELREIANLKIYIDEPYKTRSERMVMRDGTRGRNKEQVATHIPIVEKGAREFITPYKKYADIVIRNGEIVT